MSEREKQQLTQEVNILSGLRHPNIVRYYSREIAKEEGMVYLYMEYCHNGDLGSVIKHCKKTGYIHLQGYADQSEFLPEKLMWSIITQLVLALHYCHTGGSEPPFLEGSLSQNSNTTTKPPSQIVLHRDIKPENSIPPQKHD
jgi:NIMA (never in mitosis gene a)-related kinase 2